MKDKFLEFLKMRNNIARHIYIYMMLLRKKINVIIEIHIIAQKMKELGVELKN